MAYALIDRIFRACPGLTRNWIVRVVSMEGLGENRTC
jgi:hypothetical protein